MRLLTSYLLSGMILQVPRSQHGPEIPIYKPYSSWVFMGFKCHPPVVIDDCDVQAIVS